MKDNPALWQIKPGNMSTGIPMLYRLVPRSTYLTVPWFRPLADEEFTIDSGIAQYVFEVSWPAFLEVSDASNATSYLTHQVGIPGPMQIPGFTRLTKEYDKFVDDALRQISLIDSLTGKRTLYQLDMPFETIMTLFSLTERARARKTQELVQRFIEFTERLPHGLRLGLHLCLGRMNRASLGHPKDLGPLVELAMELTAVLPDHQDLEYVHLPMALSDRPVSTKADYYRPLQELSFPQVRTQLSAGLAQIDNDPDDALTARDLAERMFTRSRPIMVSTPCGLGGLTVYEYHEVLLQLRLLAKHD
jgi:hypothetical protein